MEEEEETEARSKARIALYWIGFFLSDLSHVHDGEHVN